MYAGAVVMLVYGPHKVRKDQARKTSRARRKQKPEPRVSECDSCTVCGCRMEDLHKRDESFAWAHDKPMPECEFRIANFHERINE